MCVKYEKNGHEEIYQKLFLSGWPKNWLSQVTTRGLPLVKESDLMAYTKPGYVLLTFLLFPINSKGQSCVNDLLCKVTCYSLNFMGVGIRLQGKPYSWEAVKCGTFVLASNRHTLMVVMGIWRPGEGICALSGSERIRARFSLIFLQYTWKLRSLWYLRILMLALSFQWGHIHAEKWDVFLNQPHSLHRKSWTRKHNPWFFQTTTKL